MKKFLLNLEYVTQKKKKVNTGSNVPIIFFFTLMYRFQDTKRLNIGIIIMALLLLQEYIKKIIFIQSFLPKPKPKFFFVNIRIHLFLFLIGEIFQIHNFIIYVGI